MEQTVQPRDSRPKPPRAIARINSTLDRRLVSYAIAAGAVGVGMLALVQPSEAKIVYTPANVTLNPGYGNVPLDLNNDGVVDLNFLYRGITYGTALFAYPVPGNAVVGATNGGAAVLPWGARIGPKDPFTSYLGGLIAGRAGCHPYCQSIGDWPNKKEWYLGIKFSIAGQTHYGWARLSVSKPLSGFSATLTGYAYETIANKPIIAGKTSGPAVGGAADREEILPPKKQQPTLAILARGYDHIAIWRREEDNV